MSELVSQSVVLEARVRDSPVAASVIASVVALEIAAMILKKYVQVRRLKTV